jgi:hypothetical protein
MHGNQTGTAASALPTPRCAIRLWPEVVLAVCKVAQITLLTAAGVHELVTQPCLVQRPLKAWPESLACRHVQQLACQQCMAEGLDSGRRHAHAQRLAALRMAMTLTCWPFEVLLSVCILAGVTVVAPALLPPAARKAHKVMALEALQTECQQYGRVHCQGTETDARMADAGLVEHHAPGVDIGHHGRPHARSHWGHRRNPHRPHHARATHASDHHLQQTGTGNTLTRMRVEQSLIEADSCAEAAQSQTGVTNGLTGCMPPIPPCMNCPGIMCGGMPFMLFMLFMPAAATELSWRRGSG